MIPSDILQAGLQAREQLSASARTAASVNLNGARGASSVPKAMLAAANASIFADALLQAMHARLEEYKTASGKS